MRPTPEGERSMKTRKRGPVCLFSSLGHFRRSFSQLVRVSSQRDSERHCTPELINEHLDISHKSDGAITIFS